MVFDRETVYGIQNVHDSISFISVQDTTFRHHNTMLPEFKCDMTRQRKDDGINTLIQNITHQTTGEGHHQRKLAIKDKMIKEDIVRCMRQYPGMH